MRDVIVVGGGPVGSYLASELAAAGYGVVVIDKKEYPGERVCCTGIISRECIDSFPVDNRVIMRWVNGACLLSPAGRVLNVCRRQPQAFILDRPAFDRQMAERARGSGAEYHFGRRVEGVTFRDDRVEVEVGGNGPGRKLAARVVVVATGFGAPLTRQIGLGRAGDFVAGAQVDVETSGIDEVAVYFGSEVAPGFFAWLVPTTAGTARAGLLSRRNPRLYLERFLASLRAEGKVMSVLSDPVYGGIPLKPLARTFGDRLLVVGDAAGQVKPTTGGGIYYGLLCADIAARKLRPALLSDNLSAQSLAGYERAWRRRLGRELKIGYYARRLYERLDDRQVDRLFHIAASRGIVDALADDADLSFDWHSKVFLRLLPLLGRRTLAEVGGMLKRPFSSVR